MGTHVDMKRYIPVQITFSCLKKAQCLILLTVYCLSGYDTCSAFFLNWSKVSFQNHDTEFFFKVKGLKDLGSGPLSYSVKSLPVLSLLELYLENQTLHP